MERERIKRKAALRRPFLFVTVLLLVSVILACNAGPVYAKSKKKKKTKYKYTVTLAHAKNDERGKGSWASVGSKPGDQTKKEVCMEPYGYYSGWTWSWVARPKSRAAAKIIASQAIKGCKNNKIGYGKGEPSLQTEAEKVNFKLDKIKKKCYTDCFQFAGVCCQAAGITASPIYLDDPADAEYEIEYDGEKIQHSYDVFDILKDKAHRKKIKPQNLKVGDILVKLGKKKRHVAVVCKVKKTRIR